MTPEFENTIDIYSILKFSENLFCTCTMFLAISYNAESIHIETPNVNILASCLTEISK